MPTLGQYFRRGIKKMTLDNERFFIEFSDGDNRWDPFVLYFNVAQNNITAFWKECFIKNYMGSTEENDNPHLLDKRYMQRGYTEISRNIEVACIEMNYAINIINTNLNPVGYPFIDLEFTPEKVKNKDIYRDLMNQIHHQFELLIGQVWNLSDWYLDADEKTRWAIHQINNYCHEIESYVDAESDLDEGLVYGQTGLNFCCNQNRDGIKRQGFEYFDLREEHLGDFMPQDHGWGVMIPYYSQLGKTPREAFMDNDEHIDKNNITATRYMTGEINISLAGPGVGQGIITPVPLEGEEMIFKEWLESKGWDYHDPSLCIGTAIMGQVDFSLYPGSTWKDLDSLVKRCDNITEIGFVDENMNKVLSQRYDYTWQEQYQAELDYFGLTNPHSPE